MRFARALAVGIAHGLVVALGHTLRVAPPLAGAAAIVVGVGELAHSVPVALIVAGWFALVYDHRRP